MPLMIYHNPRCSKSRKTLEIISESGVPHTIVEYLDDPPASDRIVQIAKLLDTSVADLLRRGESEFQNATDLPDIDDDHALANWIQSNPRVLQRPIVVDDDRERAIVGRPPENVIALIRE